MLQPENHIDNFKNIISLNRKLTRKGSKLRYTKSGNRNERFCGWYRSVVIRFIKLVQIGMINRDITKSKELEMKVKSSYADICGKIYTQHGGGQNSNNSDESNNEDLETRSGFEG